MENLDEKKSKKKNAGGEPEKHWKKLIDVYFGFYRDHFRDQDGYRLSPDWSHKTRGMEAKGLKGIIIFLREISEGKKIEWSEQYACERLNDFLERAYNNSFLKKNFYCALLNKKKVDVLTGSYHPLLAKKILEEWYFKFPEYTTDYEKDKQAAERIIIFFKEQCVLSSVVFTDSSAIQTWSVVIDQVKSDEFWSKKSLTSISNNLQELFNRIKSLKHGHNKAFTRAGVASEINRRYKN